MKKLKSLKVLYDELMKAESKGLLHVQTGIINQKRLEVHLCYSIPIKNRMELLNHIKENYNVTAWQKNLSIIEIVDNV